MGQLEGEVVQYQGIQKFANARGKKPFFRTVDGEPARRSIVQALLKNATGK